jgi:hypothetical protein
MRRDVDPRIISLFRGETRVLTLAALSNAGGPLTGYRVTKLTGAQPTKVYEELRQLASSGIIKEATTERGRRGWEISDPDLQSFFKRRVRVFSAEAWTRAVDERVRRRKAIPDPLLDLSRYRANPGAVPNRKEFERSPGKDRILAAAGLRPSRRHNLRRL